MCMAAQGAESSEGTAPKPQELIEEGQVSRTQVVSPLHGSTPLLQPGPHLHPSWMGQPNRAWPSGPFSEPYECLPEGDDIPISLLRK